MKVELTEEQRALRSAARDFVTREIAPHAAEWDREEALPRAVIDKLIEKGWLGSIVSVEHGGLGLDMVSYGVLNEEIGRGCSSTRSLLTVHDMVCQGLLR
ncbi:MAG TPA: acyl-CoA dehydrogenase family protein, partial [Thermoanaerobaculia bacterium]|nr:acyl-CoA dehydrogenase family protein [Thermoanaerobaculia bacterium]